MTTAVEKRVHRSVSQYNQYKRCSWAYYLERVKKVWTRPAAWLPQGLAVHEAAEAYELSGRTLTLDEMQEVFRESYAKHTNRLCKDTPNFNWWSNSGPYGGEADIERRYDIGLEQCEKYITWYEKHPEEVLWITPDGEPAAEIGFDFDLDGVLVRGFIDAVIERDGELIVRDNKTGNSPGDDFQLGVYGVAIADKYGVDPPQKGDYYMAGKKGKPGKPTYPYNIGEWTREKVSAEFRWLDENVREERFEPDPETDKCKFCSVSASCEFSA